MIHHARRTSRLALAAALGLAVTAAGVAPAGAVGAPVGLGTAASFAVLAGSAVTNTGPSVIAGDLGVSPGSAVTGFPPGFVSAGTIHATDAVAAQAQADLVTAYDDAAGRSTSATISADLGGRTLVSGVYTGATLSLTGTLTLDAQGDPDAVFVLQAGSTLVTASASRVELIGSARACNVYWQVGSSATLGTSSVFVGTVMALTSITATTSAAIEGRLLARNGAVTLDSNVFTGSTCGATPAPEPTPPTTSAPLPTDDGPEPEPLLPEETGLGRAPAATPVTSPTTDAPTDATPMAGTPTDGTETRATPDEDTTSTVAATTSGTLPRTGAPVAATTGLGVGLVLAGLLALWGVRRHGTL